MSTDLRESAHCKGGLVAARLTMLYPSLSIKELTARAVAAFERDPSLSVDDVVNAVSATAERDPDIEDHRR